MIWSKIKAQFERLLAPSLRGRLHVHVTEYTRANTLWVGRGWITLDGIEVVCVEIPSVYCTHFDFGTDTLDFGKAVTHYLTLPIDEARRSTDPIIAGLAFLDRRLGKRVLRVTDPASLHPFSRVLFRLRCREEGLPKKVLDSPA